MRTSFKASKFFGIFLVLITDLACIENIYCSVSRFSTLRTLAAIFTSRNLGHTGLRTTEGALLLLPWPSHSDVNRSGLLLDTTVAKADAMVLSIGIQIASTPAATFMVEATIG